MPTVLVGTGAFAKLRDAVLLVIGGADYLEQPYVMGLVSSVLLLSFPAMLLGFTIFATVMLGRQFAASLVVSLILRIVGFAVLALTGAFNIPCAAVLNVTRKLYCLPRGACCVWSYSACVRNMRQADR